MSDENDDLIEAMQRSKKKAVHDGKTDEKTETRDISDRK